MADARGALNALKIPVWARPGDPSGRFLASTDGGEGAEEFEPGSQAAEEMERLWVAIDRSMKAVHGAYARGARSAA